MRRYIFYIFLLVIVLGTTLFFISREKPLISAECLDAIPSDASFIFRLHSAHAAFNKLEQSTLWKSLCKTRSIEHAGLKFRFIDSLLSKDEKLKSIWNNEEVFISAHPTKARDFDLLGILKLSNKVSSKDIFEHAGKWETNGYSLRTRVFEHASIFEFARGADVILTFSSVRNLILISSTPFLVEDAIRQLKTGSSIRKSKAFRQVIPEDNNEPGIDLFVNHLGLQEYLKSYITQDYSSLLNSLGSFSRWDGFKTDIRQDKIVFSGKSSSSDTSDIIMMFRKQKPLRSDLPDILPARTAFCFRISSDNLHKTIERMHSNHLFFSITNDTKAQSESVFKSGIKKLMLDWAGTEMALFITEPGSTRPDNNMFAVILTSDSRQAASSLQLLQQKAKQKLITDNYKGRKIGRILIEDILSASYGKQFRLIKKPWYAVLDQAVIFSNQLASLKDIIDDIDNKNTLSKSLDADEKNLFHKESNLSIYLNFERSLNLLYAITPPDIYPAIENKSDLWNKFRSIQIHVTNEKEDIKTEALLSFREAPKSQAGLLWSAGLDDDIQHSPEIVDAERNSYAVITQDKSNFIYRFDESGNLQWKINIGEAVISRFYPVDYYKNGEKQILFNTKTRLFLLDKEGKSVSRFPIRLPAPASNACTLARFEGLSPDNIFVACENQQIYAYELNGKPLENLDYSKFAGKLEKPVYLIGNDENRSLFLQSENGISILDRRGKILVSEKNIDGAVLSDILLHQKDDNVAISLLTDSSGVLTFSSDIKEHTGLSYFPYAISHTLLAIPETGELMTAWLFPDSVMIADLSGASSCVIRHNKLNEGEWVRGFDNSNNQWTGLSNTAKNQFYLFPSACNSPEDFPLKGSGEFSIRKESSSARLLLSIGSGKNGIYTYRIE